ncbi:MAG TPA: DUF2339 domain-containing protein [Gaiellaceae bacterium]|nr:DUF2339 domain-containing protein [Gaiellaceae bacterium]
MSGKAILAGLGLTLVAAWFSPILAIFVLVALVVLAVVNRRERPSARNAADVAGRIAAFERKLGELEVDLQELKALAAVAGPATAPPRAAEPFGPEPVLAPPPPPEREPEMTPPPPAPPPPPRWKRPEWDLSPSDLLGARALAWAGGIVTILGVVFFFVLAVNRGWINAELRLGFGALASVAAFTAGFWLRRRYGELYSALAAAGAGIAGGYATLLAATALYGFVAELWALAAAAGIAAVAVAVALLWSAQLVAALGLVGAMVVPLMVVVEEEELSFVGTGFVAIVLAATALAGIERRWRELLLLGGGVALVQIGGLVAQTDGTDWGVVVLTAVFWLVYLGGGLAYQLRASGSTIEPLAATFLLGGAALSCYASAWLFAGEARGIHREGAALLVVAAAHGVLGAWFFRGRRELAALLWAAGLTVAAVAGAELLSGSALTVTWAGEAAILAWLAGAARERRFQLSAVAYLALALGYTLAVAAPLAHLLEENTHPARGVSSVLAIAAGAAALAWFAARPLGRPETRGRIGAFLEDLVDLARAVPAAYAWLAGLALAYAASLGLLDLALRFGPENSSTAWEVGHVAVNGFWAALALALVEAGVRQRTLRLEIGGLVLLGAAVLKTLADTDVLADERWSLSFLLVGGAALLAGHEYQRLGGRPGLQPVAAGTHLISVGLAVAGIFELAEGSWRALDLEGAWLLALAAVYGALGAWSLRAQRDLATLQWGTGLVLAASAAAFLLEDVWLVLAWAAAAAALGWLAGAVGELRLQAFSAAFLVVAVGYTLVSEAPPRDLFVAAIHPGAGVPSLACVVLAALAFAFFARHATQPAEPLGRDEPLTVARLAEIAAAAQSRYRVLALTGAGVLGLYGFSLTILEIAQAASAAGVETGFQRGHTAVSAFWGLVGVGLLYVGLTRRALPFRLAGFALFGLSLAKLFLYDLAFLSSVARALSFLAVGALLLLGGFFYQRLSGGLEERDRSAPA